MLKMSAYPCPSAPPDDGTQMIYGGRIPIQFELASRDTAGQGSDESAELEPFYLLAPRGGYLTLCCEKIRRHFQPDQPRQAQVRLAVYAGWLVCVRVCAARMLLCVRACGNREGGAYVVCMLGGGGGHVAGTKENDEMPVSATTPKRGPRYPRTSMWTFSWLRLILLLLSAVSLPLWACLLITSSTPQPMQHNPHTPLPFSSRANMQTQTRTRTHARGCRIEQ
jgi:hypothetical protein